MKLPIAPDRIKARPKRTNRLLGGELYATILQGDAFDPPIDMTLNALYYDPVAVEGLGQLFAAYDVV